MSSSTVITDYATYETSTMVFLPAQKNEIQSAPGKPAIKFFRIPIRTRNQNGTNGNLVFAPQNMFTFGVSENKDDKGSVNGYTLPLVLWNKDGPTDEQRALTSTLEAIIEECKQHLIKDDIRKSIGRPTLKYDALEKLDKLLYWKLDDNGERVQSKGPSMYPKLYTRRSEDGSITINTEFFDRQGRVLDGLSLISKYGNVTPAITFDCIYIGASISIQVRVMEAEINLINSGGRRLLLRPDANTQLSDSSSSSSVPNPAVHQAEDTKPRLLSAPAPAQTSQEEDEDDTNIIVDESVAAAPPPRTTPKKLPSSRARK